MSSNNQQDYALIRVDLRFSGSFADTDAALGDALERGIEGCAFTCEDDEVLDDLSDAPEPRR